MSVLHKISRRLAKIVFGDHSDLQAFLGVSGVLLAIGFALGTANSNYTAMMQLMHHYWWSLLFFVYGFTRLWGINVTQFHYTIEVAVSAIGIWALNYVFLSFTVFDPQPMAPTEMLLLMPVLAEVLCLTKIIYNRDCTQEPAP